MVIICKYSPWLSGVANSLLISLTIRSGENWLLRSNLSKHAKKACTSTISLCSHKQAVPFNMSQMPRIQRLTFTRPCVEKASRKTSRRCFKRIWPSADKVFTISSFCISDQMVAWWLLPASACKSCSVRPHQGARNTLSQCTRSARWCRAWVRASKSCTICRPCSASISTAWNKISWCSRRNWVTNAAKCFLARTKMAIFLAGFSACSRWIILIISAASFACAASKVSSFNLIIACISTPPEGACLQGESSSRSEFERGCPGVLDPAILLAIKAR